MRPLIFASWIAPIVGWAAFAAPHAPDKAPAPVVAIWPARPMEVRIAFDRPIDPGVAKDLVGRSIEFGDDRAAIAETTAPKRKDLDSRAGRLRIAATSIVDDGRTLLLTTDPHPREATYALAIPLEKGRSVAVEYTLNGVEAVWDDGSDEARPAWSGWLPDIDLNSDRERLAGSAEHRRLFDLLKTKGRLTLRSFLQLPTGKSVLILSSDRPISASLSGETPEAKTRLEIPVESTGEGVELTVAIPTGPGDAPSALLARYKKEGDPTERPIPPNGLILPWAPPSPPPTPENPVLPAGLVGGDPKRGEAVFLSETAKCSACHKIRDKGGEVGPDLGRLFERDAASVYRDVNEPSAVIHPDYVPYTVAFKDGRVAAGVVRAEGADAIRVLDTNAKSTVFPRSEIEELRPSGTSIMPVGLVGALGESKMRDLLAFLLAPPPKAGARAESPTNR